jgi:predicted enzyme involved in methoxymalonyl-ACP biosynthesis
MLAFADLKKNLKKDFTGLLPLRAALLGDSATQLLAQALRGAAFIAGIDLQIWEADFGQVERQVFDEESELYQCKPDIVILFQSSHKLALKLFITTTPK